jgi:hypothetical protein
VPNFIEITMNIVRIAIAAIFSSTVIGAAHADGLQPIAAQSINLG